MFFVTWKKGKIEVPSRNRTPDLQIPRSDSVSVHFRDSMVNLATVRF